MFKHKLLAAAAFLAAGGATTAWLLTRPPDEDRLRAAVRDHFAANVPGASDFDLVGLSAAASLNGAPTLVDIVPHQGKWLRPQDVAGVEALEKASPDPKRAARDAVERSHPGAVFDGLVAALIVAPLKDGRLLVLRFTRKDGAWSFDTDLGKAFDAAMKSPEVNEAVVKNLGRRLSARYRKDVSFRDGLRYEYSLVRDPQGLLGLCRIGFSFGLDGRTAGGQYVERYRFAAGAWRSEGVGSLFDRVAPPPAPK